LPFLVDEASAGEDVAHEESVVVVVGQAVAVFRFGLVAVGACAEGFDAGLGDLLLGSVGWSSRRAG